MCRSPDPVAEFSVIPISPTSDARSVFSLVVTSFLNLELGACMLLMYSKKLIQPQYSALHDFGFLSQIPHFSTHYLFFFSFGNFVERNPSAISTNAVSQNCQ